jgi:outer membrane autotransporter protein
MTKINQSISQSVNQSISQSVALGFVLFGVYSNAYAEPTVTVATGGINYTITSVQASYTANQSLLTSQPWWGNQVLSSTLAGLAQNGLGGFNGGAGDFLRALFAYGTVPVHTSGGSSVSIDAWNGASVFNCPQDCPQWTGNFFYAILVPVVSSSDTSPLLAGGQSMALMSSLHDVNHIVQARQEGALGRSTGDAFLGDNHAWFKPFGSWANQNDRNGVSGYSADTYGMVFGADAVPSEKDRFGVAFAYSNSNIDSNAKVASQSSDVDSYNVIAYGTHNINENTDFNYIAGVGYHDNEGSRNIVSTNQVAKSNNNSWSAHIGAGLARTYTLSEKTSFTPSIRADYTWLRADNYTENGAGLLNLSVNSNTAKELLLGLDGKLTREINDKINLVANLGVAYDAINEQAKITSALAGTPTASFVTNGIAPAAWTARGGLGLVSNPNTRVELSARYDFEVSNGFDNQTASAKVRWSF